MAATLDPKLDIVFKLLFVEPRNRPLLIALLQAILHPSRLIRAVKVLNPELPRADVGDKGVTLDMLAELDDGEQVDVEMQTWKRPAQCERALYNWSRRYSAGLRRGDEYDRLKPCIVVFIFAYTELPGTRFHSTFRVLEIHDGSLLSNALELHAVELPKLRLDAELDAEDSELVLWGRFLAARTDAERREVAMCRPEIEKANEALEKLSQDPAVLDLARRREEALLFFDMQMRQAERLAREEGKVEGRVEGRSEGRSEGRVEVVATLCDALGVRFDDTRRALVERMNAAELRDLLAALHQDGRWPRR